MKGIRKFCAKFFSSIKYEVFLGIALINLVVLLLFFAAASYSTHRFFISDRTESARILNAQEALLIENLIRDVDKHIMNLYFSDDVRIVLRDRSTGSAEYIDSYYSVKTRLAGIIDLYPEIYGIYMFDLDGKHLYSLQRQPVQHFIKNQDGGWFREALDRNGAVHIQGRHESMAESGKEVITISRKVVDFKTYKGIGVVTVEVDIDELSSHLMNGNFEESAVMMVMDQDNRVYSNNESLCQGILADIEFTDKLNSNQNYFWYKSQGKNYYVVWRESEITQWKIVTCIPREDMLDLSARLIRIFIFSALVAVILSIFISYLYSARSTKRITNIVEQLNRFSEGDRGIIIQVNEKNEIGFLQSYLNVMIQKINAYIQTEYEEKILRKDMEIRLLYSQINPHFLYNTLGMIINEAEKEGAENTTELIELLSGMFRYNLQKEQYLVPLKKEIEYIQSYLLLLKKRYGEGFTAIFELDHTLDEYPVPHIFLQPLIENCIVHGSCAGQEKLDIIIRTLQTETEKLIIIKNTGNILSREQVKELNDMVQREFEVGKQERVKTLQNINFRLKTACSGQCGLIFEFDENYVVLKIRIG